MKYLFANHELDTQRRELKRGSRLVAVEPQVFDLIVHLVENRDRVVSKDDLIASVWGRAHRIRLNFDHAHQRGAPSGG